MNADDGPDTESYEITGANAPAAFEAQERAPADEAWQAAERVLCVRLDTIGDVLMTTPAIRAFAENGPPERRITLLTSSRGAEVAGLVPEIDDVIAYDPPWMKLTENAPDDPALDRSILRMLENRRFDAAAIFTAATQDPLPAALLCYLAGIPLRLARSRDKAYRLLTHRLQDGPASSAMHEVERQLSLAASVGARSGNTRLSLSVGGSDSGFEALLGVGMDPCRPYFVAHVGVSAESRRYPTEMFGEAVRMIAQATGLTPVFTAGPGEEPLARKAKAAARSGHVIAHRSLAVLAEIIASADLLVTGNTGPAHIAAAVQTSVVDIYAMTNPSHEPWDVAARVLTNPVPCAYCYSSICADPRHTCLTGIGPRRVAEAALDLLQESTSPPKPELAACFRS